MRLFLLVCAAAVLAGCGYVGDPLPPALEIPIPVADLNVVQRGNRLMVGFTAPALTTEAIALRRFERVELRVGPIPNPFSIDTWASQATPIDVAAEPGKSVHVEAASNPWQGREVLAAVRLAGPKGRLSEWSNTVVVRVSAPLEPPAPLAAEPHPDGVRVFWPAAGGLSYRVYKQGSGTPEPVIAGVVNSGEFIDREAKLGATYSYRVQAINGNVESELSAITTFASRDVFPPAAPSGLTAVAGVGSVELTWERRTEADLAGYRVYRAAGAGALERVAEAIADPTYSDRQVTGGTVYRYAISAVDRAGNESARSAEVSITAP